MNESVVFLRVFHSGISEVETFYGTPRSRAEAIFTEDQEALGNFFRSYLLCITVTFVFRIIKTW